MIPAPISEPAWIPGGLKKETDLPRGARLRRALLVLSCATALLVTGCVSASLERTAELREIALHLSYLSGGDAPLGQTLVFFADGTVRFRTPGRKASWAKLSLVDQREFNAVVQSGAFREAVGRLPRDVCCDLEVLTVSFTKTTEELDAVLDPPTIDLNLFQFREQEPELRRFLLLLDELGGRYFGRRYLEVL
ncbi:MAG TPA: hypothetical protein VHN15_13455 [Thermoanaerobaculia bacterium]|nr:hypothetical protein [Thermoanaerobaculia bacterium]